MTNPRDLPSISVVIASLVGQPFIDDCLASLEKEAKELGAEVIVIACGADSYAQRISQKFTWVQVIHRTQRESVPELRRIGIEKASGNIVMIIEEHCLADKNWIHEALKAHARGDYGAVGGPVVDHNYKRVRDWVVYFCEYSGHLPPMPNGPVGNLNGANIAYKRQLLLEHKHLLGEGYWETSLHSALLSRGVRFLSVPGMLVYHRGPFAYGYYLRQRYWFSRAFAGARAKTLRASHRLAYLVLAPLVPALLLVRMALRVWQKRCHVEKFAMSLPLLIPALTIYAAGEWVGYLAGSGDALSKVE